MQLYNTRDASPFPCRTLQEDVDQEATVPHTVPCGEGRAAFELVLERLGLEVPAGLPDADFIYDDDASHSDGDGESDDDDDDGDGESDNDDDDDGDARVIKNPRLVPCDDFEMGALPAAGAAVAVVCRWLASSVAPCNQPSADAGASRS